MIEAVAKKTRWMKRRRMAGACLIFKSGLIGFSWNINQSEVIEIKSGLKVRWIRILQHGPRFANGSRGETGVTRRYLADFFLVIQFFTAVVLVGRTRHLRMDTCVLPARQYAHSEKKIQQKPKETISTISRNSKMEVNTPRPRKKIGWNRVFTRPVLIKWSETGSVRNEFNMKILWNSLQLGSILKYTTTLL